MQELHKWQKELKPVQKVERKLEKNVQEVCKKNKVLKGFKKAHVIFLMTSPVKDDIPWFRCDITFSRYDDGNLPVGCSRKIVLTFVTIFIEVKKDSTILLRIQMGCQLMACLYKAMEGCLR